MYKTDQSLTVEVVLVFVLIPEEREGEGEGERGREREGGRGSMCVCMYVCEGNEGNEKGGLDVIDIKFYLCFSLIPQKTSFAGLTEACYSAQKTYRLVLCKYLTLLRQAHTKDMVRERRERGGEGERERERKKERDP